MLSGFLDLAFKRFQISHVGGHDVGTLAQLGRKLLESLLATGDHRDLSTASDNRSARRRTDPTRGSRYKQASTAEDTIYPHRTPEVSSTKRDTNICSVSPELETRGAASSKLLEIDVAILPALAC